MRHTNTTRVTSLATVIVLTTICTAARAQGLTVDSAVISASGGTQTLFLDAGPSNAGAPYVIVGTGSGTSPGTPFLGQTIPVNRDAYTDLTVTLPNNVLLPMSVGALDAAGRAETSFVLPFPLPPGLRLDHAFFTVDPAAGTIPFVSNAAPVVLGADTLDIDGLVDGSTIGTPIVDVSGPVGTALSGAPGLAITVNGQVAQLLPGAGPGGTDRYRLAELALATGTPSTITVEATATGTDVFERRSVTVTATALTANNVALDGTGQAFLARGPARLSVLDLESRQFVSPSLPPGVTNVDDVAYADGFVFLLDATGTDTLTVIDANSPHAVLSGPINVSLSLFSGVSAGGGLVAVSGGTSLVSIRSYSPTGSLFATSSVIDLGIGQPDVVLARDGAQAFVSTDFSGSVGGSGFGVTVLDLAAPPTPLSIASRTGFVGAGFSSGTSQPANFPIVSAQVSGDRYVVAHGGGLSLARAATAGVLSTLPNTAGVNHVASEVGPVPSDRVFAVGQSPNRIIEALVTANDTLVLVGNQSIPVSGGFLAIDVDSSYVVAVSPTGNGTFVRVR